MEKEEKEVNSFRSLTAAAAAGCGSPLQQFLDFQVVNLDPYALSWAIAAG
jgi:hypothetical protein